MKNENNDRLQLSTSLTETIATSELANISRDLLEVGIDSVLKDGLFKEIPIINVLNGIWKTGVAIRDHRFLNKLVLFFKRIR